MAQRITNVPEVPGVDLDFRPRTYFGPIRLETQILARVMGHVRRELLRTHLDDGKPCYPSELELSLLDDDLRDELGRIHPAFMGGEYLPPLLDDETEIARISLASVTADQISVRARRVGRRIAYRVVDEYMDEEPPPGESRYACRPATSQRPLTLRQLVTLIDTAGDGGIVWPILQMNRRCGSDIEGLCSFVTVSSEFYPTLRPYYEARVDAWLDGQRAPADAE